MQPQYDKNASVRELLTDDKFRYYFQMEMVCVLLGLASLAMGIMNIFTHKTVLMVATMSFAGICGMNYLILRIYKRANHVSYAIFEASIFALFVYFLITGGTAGFSPLWILILPSCGMILLGERRGAVLSGLMFLIVAFLLWTPWGNALLRCEDYTPEFRMRFPVVYLVFFVLGFAFELIRSVTYKTMVEAQDKLAVIARTDTLTALPNRYWFNERINDGYAHRPVEFNGLMIIVDIDDFKRVNDLYGHAVGDETIIRVGQAIRSQIREKDLLCRWGGEEFFAYLPRCEADAAPAVCERICSCVRNTLIECEKEQYFHVTVSIGAVHIYAGTVLEPERMFIEADRMLYAAKEQGKDRYNIE